MAAASGKPSRNAAKVVLGRRTCLVVVLDFMGTILAPVNGLTGKHRPAARRDCNDSRNWWKAGRDGGRELCRLPELPLAAKRKTASPQAAEGVTSFPGAPGRP